MLEKKNRGTQTEKLALSQFIKATSTCASSGKQMRFWTFMDAFGSHVTAGHQTMW